MSSCAAQADEPGSPRLACLAGSLPPSGLCGGWRFGPLRVSAYAAAPHGSLDGIHQMPIYIIFILNKPVSSKMLLSSHMRERRTPWT